MRPGNRCTSLMGLSAAVLAFLSFPVQGSGQQMYDFGTAFGRAAAVAGGEVLIGEPQNVVRPGRVYVFRPTTSEWLNTQVLTASDAVRADGFGRAIAAHDDAFLVGAPQARDSAGAAYLFLRSDEGWREAVRLEARDGARGTGGAVAVSATAAAVVEQGEAGERVRVYSRDGGNLREEATLVAASEDRRFGGAVAFLGEDRLMVCAADAEGSLIVERFSRQGTGAWTPSGTLETGAPFTSTGGLVSQDPYKECGLAVDDGVVAVGTRLAEDGAGAVTVFVVDDSGALVRDTVLTAPQGAEGGFGTTVGFSGGSLWVGAPEAGRRMGAVARFDRVGDGWSDAIVLTGPGRDFMPVFGLALAVGPELAVVGSPGDAYGAGVAVGFQRSGSSWSQATRLEGEAEGYEEVMGDAVECAEGSALIFSCDQMDLVALLPVRELGGSRGAMVNDVWGWTDPETGREYAVVGRSEGTSFVDVTESSRPVYLGQLPKTEGSRGQAWRDVKVLRDHALVVADNAGEHGMQVFDLTRLRDVDPANPPTFEADALYTEIASAHNVAVNEESGYAYTVGMSGAGNSCASIHMIDLSDPDHPTFAGCYDDPSLGRVTSGQTHDAQCILYRGPDTRYQGREICFAYGESGISIGDVTDKDAAVVLSNANMPNTVYIHQGWITDDHRYIYVNDELDEQWGLTDRTRTIIWDVTELDDPVLAGVYLGETAATDHNLYVRGNMMYQSNYAAGLRVIDISDPVNPSEVGFFDTAPFDRDVPGYQNGSWSNYPFFESGNILVTSHKQGLFVLKRRVPVS